MEYPRALHIPSAGWSLVFGPLFVTRRSFTAGPNTILPVYFAALAHSLSSVYLCGSPPALFIALLSRVL